MSELYIGLMSGTSADGIDAALVDLSDPQPKLLSHHYQPYDSKLRQQILSLNLSGNDEITKLGELDVLLGKSFANAVSDLLKISSISSHEIAAIGSHGQTIRHVPQHKFTLQIGDPNIIAAETGITTVADFRRRDIAHGGQGAPLVPAFHQQIFNSDKNRIVVNIGGIANITILSGNLVSGFDTGPGNALLDAWAEIHLNKPHDDKGAWAAAGKINLELLENLLCDAYFKLPTPKSTGREYFNLNWLEKFLVKKIPPIDVQTTLVELTARTILDAIPFSSGEIFVCGGGVHNDFLMSRLSLLSKNFLVHSTEKLGVHPDWVEAMAFAWLAKQTLKKQPGNVKNVTGATQKAILGGVYFV